MAGLLEPVLRLPDPESAGPDGQPARTERFKEALAAWAQGQAHASMAPALAASPDTSPRATAMHAQVRRAMNGSTLRCLGEDDVNAREIERNGARAARIVYCSLIKGGDALALKFYLDGGGALIDIAVEGW